MPLQLQDAEYQDWLEMREWFRKRRAGKNEKMRKMSDGSELESVVSNDQEPQRRSSHLAQLGKTRRKQLQKLKDIDPHVIEMVKESLGYEKTPEKRRDSSSRRERYHSTDSYNNLATNTADYPRPRRKRKHSNDPRARAYSESVMSEAELIHRLDVAEDLKNMVRRRVDDEPHQQNARHPMQSRRHFHRSSDNAYQRALNEGIHRQDFRNLTVQEQIEKLRNAARREALMAKAQLEEVLEKQRVLNKLASNENKEFVQKALSGLGRNETDPIFKKLFKDLYE